MGLPGSNTMATGVGLAPSAAANPPRLCWLPKATRYPHPHAGRAEHVLDDLVPRHGQSMATAGVLKGKGAHRRVQAIGPSGRHRDDHPMVFKAP
jgi:hypothetical protein